MNALLQNPAFVIISIGALVGIAASTVGVFLLLRRQSMLSDAISHSILFGIVIVFLATGDADDPLLLVGAAAAGVLTVFLVQMLTNSKLVKQDAAIGLVFPMLFAAGLLLLTLYADRVHLDTHSVLLGEIAFSWLETINIGAVEIPRLLLTMLVVAVVILLCVTAFYKELMLSVFDEFLAASFGFRPQLLLYGLFSLASIVAVAAFDAVGTLLLIAFMTVPATAARVLVDSVWLMVFIAALISVVSAIAGYWGAVVLDVSIGGMMALVSGALLAVVYVAAPRYGIIAQRRSRRRQWMALLRQHLLLHLLTHEASQAGEENTVQSVCSHSLWSKRTVSRVINELQKERMIRCFGEEIRLTDKGRRLIQRVSCFKNK